MKHLILGAGNLGIDIKNEVIRQSGERRNVDLVSLSEGLDVRDLNALRATLARDDYDVIWYCVGQGSVQQAKDDPESARLIYGNAPKLVAASARVDAKVIIFSTDYVADENDPGNPNAVTQEFLSEYASIRAKAEQYILHANRPNTAIVRVGSLYGTHKPDKTFPGRILASFGQESDTRIRLPRNLVTPTPTLWLASVLVSNLERMFNAEETVIHHCSPLGNVSVWDWATFVLKGIREPSAFSHDEFFDEERPKISALGSTFLETNWNWFELWQTYFKPEWFTLPDPQPSDEAPTEPTGAEALADTKA